MAEAIQYAHRDGVLHRDLSAQFNASLTNSWLNALLWPGNDLASLPTGRQKLAGVEFDGRGIVQLGAYPDVAVQSIDFNSAISCSAPFLLAITAD